MTAIVWIFLRKAWIEKKRHPFRSLFITLVPFLFLLAILNTAQHIKPRDGAEYATTPEDDLADSNVPGELINKIYYTPNTTLTDTIVQAMRRTLYMEEERIVPFSSETELEYELLDTEYICYGVVFRHVSDDGQLRYTVRTKNNNFRTDATYSRDVFNVYRKNDDEYIKSGFLAIQNAIDRAYMSHLEQITDTGGRQPVEHVSRRYGHIPVDESRGPADSTSAYYVVIWYIAIATFVGVYLLLLPLVEERACGGSEYLKIACSESYWNEGTIFFYAFLHMFSMFLLSLIFCLLVGPVWDGNPAQVIYLVMLELLFVVNLIAFIFFLSSTLESSTVAIGVAPICLFVPFMIGSICQSLSFVLCVLPVNGFYTGATIFLSYKSSGHLFRAHDLYTSVYPSIDGLSLSSIYLMQILGILVWAFLWFYVTNVFPGRYGTPKSKGFFLSSNYWRTVRNSLTGSSSIGQRNKVTAERRRSVQVSELGGIRNVDHDGRDSISLEIIGSAETIEERPVGSHTEPVVLIKKLNKVFRGRWRGSRAKVAVKDFSISIYSHSITVLLGHNGAGKTTTMNIITGMLPRTSGSIVVDGEHDPNRYRQRIGFCPQHNVFYSFLTCREHLLFYGRLRGLGAAEAQQEAESVLKKVNLHEKSNAFVHTLSGGMKRRLSLANAIIGHTKVLILDEPTSGLDPESRRDIWDLLLKLRKDHTILLTTHFMEEADILGDWIAIMEYGELVAFGTPLFLKQMYGKGYTLKLQKAPGFDGQRTMALVRQHVPDASVRDSVQEVFACTLPYGSVDHYPSLLSTLEAQQPELAIETISMSNASLEEVFLNSSKVNKVMQHHQESTDRVDSPLKMPPSSSVFVTASKQPGAVRTRAARNTCAAIWRKKYIHMRANAHIYGALLAIPIVVATLCFWITSGHTDVATALPAVTLNSYSIRQALGVITINRATSENDIALPRFTREAILAQTPTLSGMELLVQENVSLADALQTLIEQDYTAYRDRVVVGIECNTTGDSLAMTILHNNNLVHSSGIGEAVAATLLLRYQLGVPDPMVEVQNIPSTRKLLIDTGTPYFYTELVPIAFMFSILIFMLVPLLEHQTGFRQLQNINRYVYWGSTYACDLLTYMVVVAIVIPWSIFMDRRDAFAEPMYMHITFAVLLYGVQALLVVYIISMCVENANTAITIMSYLMIIGVGGVVLLSSGYDDIQENSFWNGILHVVPEFAFKHSMRIIYENQKLIVTENPSRSDTEYEKRKLSLAKMYFVPLLVVPLLVLVLNEIVENIYRREKVATVRFRLGDGFRKIAGLWRYVLCWRNVRENGALELHDAVDASVRSYDETDSLMKYVQEESATVDKLLDGQSGGDERDKYAIVVKQLKKAYYDEPHAVQRISFAVKKGECFGLLGMNGAGKTTVFQMLSRNLPISAGEIHLQHCEVQQADALEYRDQYGYCPQVDMLLDFMTVHETIDYFSRLKHIPARESHIMHWLTAFDILAYKDHVIGECSGGTKRKVNTILALLGGPSVVLLDEPTTGVDPKSRRFLWKCIKAKQRQDQTVLLTSHSMDECEELCNRLSIMVDGKLRCIGSILQLKKRHGQGYTVLMKLNNASLTAEAPDGYESFICEVKDQLNATLREEHKGMIKLSIDPSVKLSDLFRQVNELKASPRGEDILSYSINETSLEDIFMKFRPKHGVVSG